jgi:hypothetical protein
MNEAMAHVGPQLHEKDKEDYNTKYLTVGGGFIFVN